MGECEDKYLPPQDKWSHDKKLELSKKRGTVNAAYFEKLASPLNSIARELKLNDATYIFALSSHESGWLNEENTWLNNPFGLTKAGGDNLGFLTLAQSFDYWKCKYGNYVAGATSMDAFMAGLKAAKYNTAAAYFDHDKWESQFQTVRRWAGKFGYKTRDDGGTIVLVPG